MSFVRHVLPPIFLFGACFCAPALAGGLRRGAVELAPELVFSYRSHPSDYYAYSTKDLTLGGVIGYSVSDLVEIYGSPIYTYNSRQGERAGGSGYAIVDSLYYLYPLDSYSSSGWGLVGGVILNFSNSGNGVPFLRGGLGVGEGGWLASLGAGLRFLVGNSGSVNLGLGYTRENSEGGESVNDVSMIVGVSLLMRNSP